MLFLFLLLIAQELSVFAPEFRRVDSTLTTFRTIHQSRISNEHSLWVVLAEPPRDYEVDPESRLWSKDALLGIFLRDTAGRISTVATFRTMGECEGGCNVEVDHADAGSVVLFRTGDPYGTLLPALKVFIDPITKRMVRTVEYWPAAVHEIWIEGGKLFAQFSRQQAPDHLNFVVEEREGRFETARSAYVGPVNPSLPASWSLVESTGSPGEFTGIAEATGTTPRIYELSKTNRQALARLRPRAVRDEFGPIEVAEINDHIGPYQLIGNLLWFGKTFYDGEGSTGVGGFGYFDFQTRRFVTLAPPAIRDWSASAILVEPDAIWIGLANRPEGAENSGGLLRYDRNTMETTVLPVKNIIRKIVRHYGTLYLGTEHGMAVVPGGSFSRYLLEPDLAGSPAIVEVTSQ